MKKSLALLVAAMLCACCLGLAACGGSSSSSAASESASASASSESASASASSDSASVSADASSAASASASASSAAADGVSPELQAAAEKLGKVADEQEALVEKAKAAGSYDAVKADWEKLNTEVSDATGALKPWAEKYANGELSDADKAYYMRVVVPNASRSASAGLDMLDLIK